MIMMCALRFHPQLTAAAAAAAASMRPGWRGFCASTAIGVRIEHDSMGPIEVPADRLWGAVTQRSLANFHIGEPSVERMPEALIRALGSIKRAAAQANMEVGRLAPEIGNAIMAAASEVAVGALSDHFPLIVWQTGSGTQTNMNANEVIANRAMQLLGRRLGLAAGKELRVHPNDHVNLGQSSNDTIPTAMHVAAALELHNRLLPALHHLQGLLGEKEAAFKDIIKIGRTHLQDATPLTAGQEISAWRAQVAHGGARVRAALTALQQLAQGGTAVGTGLNTWQGFDARVAHLLSNDLGLAFAPAANKFEAIASHDALVHAHGALNTVAVSLMKIGNDLRLLGSGPRCGLGELQLPANEPGSSIMPGKVNPTQPEMVTMVACQVMGNHTAVTIAGSQGQLQLNAFKPVIIANVLRSTRLLADAARSLADNCVHGMGVDAERMEAGLRGSLMLVTGLVRAVGYDKAAAIAKAALQQRMPLADAAIAAGLTAEQVRDALDPWAMIQPYHLPTAE